MTASEIEEIQNHRDFIQKNLHQDPVRLLLKHSHDAGKKLAIAQIAARQKIKKKLPEWYAHPGLVLPPGLGLEQCSSETTARLKASLIQGTHLLDITGGMAVDVFYLSKNFGQATYVENNPELYTSSAYNLKKLNPKIETLQADGVDVLKDSPADVVYIDPYRRDHTQQKVVALKSYTPDVTQLLPHLIKNGRTTLIKTSPMLDVSQAISQLQVVAEVWVLSVRNECKELIFVLREDAGSPTLRTFNSTTDGLQQFDFGYDQKEVPELSMPLQYLYEPNASILKSGGQDIVAHHHGLKKLHPHSHLYTSSEKVSGFPGKTFAVVQVLPPYDRSLAKGRYNVISRNFQQKADKIEKKLKLLPAKDDFLIATKSMDNRPAFITAKWL